MIFWIGYCCRSETPEPTGTQTVGVMVVENNCAQKEPSNFSLDHFWN